MYSSCIVLSDIIQNYNEITKSTWFKKLAFVELNTHFKMVPFFEAFIQMSNFDEKPAIILLFYNKSCGFAIFLLHFRKWKAPRNKALSEATWPTVNNLIKNRTFTWPNLLLQKKWSDHWVKLEKAGNWGISNSTSWRIDNTGNPEHVNIKAKLSGSLF